MRSYIVFFKSTIMPISGYITEEFRISRCKTEGFRSSGRQLKSCFDAHIIIKMGTSGRYTHYSTSYKNIKEKLAGYCENCDRNAFNAKEENWPKPGIGNWIAMAVSVALALGGAAIAVNQFKQEAEMNTTLATVGTLGALGGIALFIAFLRSYLSDVKVYKWHQAGNRHTFHPPTENNLSCDVVKYYQPGPDAYFRYFDLGYIRMMNGTYFSS